jgi:ornithine cyclodeaminase/alanine dehydrogenase-like protein (mu-crystallin family)
MFSLTEEQVRDRLDPIRLIAGIESAFRDRYPSTVIPPRTHIPIEDGIFLIMPCYDRHGATLGVKFVTVLNKLPLAEGRVRATYMLFDPARARPELVIPANHLTDLRTAATSAVATKFLGRENARVLGIVGTGRQARAHIKMLPLVREFHRALVCGRDFEQSRTFAAHVSKGLNLQVDAADASTCAAESDVICTCTTAQAPLFDGRLLRPGTHLNLVGAFQTHAREVDSVTIQRSRVVVDTYDGVLAEAGDILIPMGEGGISRAHLLADLHELTAGKRVRQSPDDITVFKSVGCALEDLVAAELLRGSSERTG